MCATLIAVGLTADHFNGTRKERQLSAAVSAIGGRIGSIPGWPLGTEYRISLTRVPTDEELKQLAVANTTRGWVGIAFQDCEISRQREDRLRASLHNCHLFVVQNGTTSPLGRTGD